MKCRHTSIHVFRILVYQWMGNKKLVVLGAQWNSYWFTWYLDSQLLYWIISSRTALRIAILWLIFCGSKTYWKWICMGDRNTFTLHQKKTEKWTQRLLCCPLDWLMCSTQKIIELKIQLNISIFWAWFQWEKKKCKRYQNKNSYEIRVCRFYYSLT